MRPRLTALRVARATALLVLALVVFGNSYGHFHTDIKPEVYVAPGRMLVQYLSSWSPTPYLGSANFNVGLVPVLVVTAALRATGLDPEMTFKVFHLVLWVVGASGAGRLLRELVPRVSPWAVLATGVAFLANPYTVTGGSTLAIALPMCLLPWLLVALLRALRTPSSWVWPAVTGMLLFAMSGMNVAVVPIYQLLMAVPLVLVVRRAWGVTWSAVLKVVGKCAVFAIGVSLYWVVPAIAAQRTGTQVVKGSETLEGIAKVSSFVEVLRGLGMWTLYGRSDTGAWLPQYAVYITGTVVVLVTALWPALSLLALRWAPPVLARFAALSAALAAVVMVGLFPRPDAVASPAGWLMGVVFEHVPGTVAFRTSNKIGAVLTLSFALLLGYGAHRLARRMRHLPGAPPLAAGSAFVLVLLWAIPAFAGALYTSEFDVPEYWEEAAGAVNDGSATGRVLLLPGQARSHYRWSQERPDDVSNSLFERDAVIPETTWSTSAGGGNFLGALDDTLQTEAPYGNAVSTYARYLGADQILLRHDVVWEELGGARPGTTARVLANDPGLFGERNFGKAGENVLPPTIPPESYEEALLSPVQLYAVKDAEPTVRVKPMHGSMIIAGDAWSIPPLAREGLLQRTPVLRYAGDLEEGDLEASLGRSNRLVLSDTNRRRAAVTNRLTAGNGPLLAADEEPELTRALGGPDDQTVLVRSGIRASGTEEGAAFFSMPNAVAEHAVDGEPRTSWIFGDFRRAPGMRLDLELPAARELGKVTLSQPALGPVTIDEVEVKAGDQVVTGRFGGERTTTVDLGGTRTDEVTVTVKSLHGQGFNLVGLSEVDLGIPDRAERVARLPLTLDTEYGQLDGRQRADFARTPLDVYLTRQLGTPSLLDDTEIDLRRDFTLPDDRTMRPTARLRMLGDWEPEYDRLEGHGDEVTFRSSGVFFNNPQVRASRAADDEAQSAWVPDSNMEGAWWEVRGPRPRTVETVTITQGDAFGTDRDGTRFAKRVSISVDGRKVGEGQVGPGRSVVTLDRPTRGRTVRITVEETTGKKDETGNARFLTIDAGMRLPEASGGSERACRTVATLDGRPLAMRPAGDGGVALADSEGALWEACEDLRLTWGEHQLRPVDDIRLDAVTFRDVQGLKDVKPAPAPTSQVEPGFGGGVTVRTGAAKSPYAIVLGQGFDPRWQASMDGESLGPPQQLDGYSVGWVIEDPAEPHEIVISFGPQQSATIAALASASVLLVAGYLVGNQVVQRRRTDDSEEEPAAGIVGERVGTDPPGSPVETDERDPDEEPGPLWPALRERLGDPRVVGLGVVAAATFAAGLTGLVASVLALLLVRSGRAAPARLIDLGAGLVVLAALVYVVGPGRTGGTVSANAIAESLWPHRLAGAGLVLAVIGALWHTRPADPHDPPEETHEPAAD